MKFNKKFAVNSVLILAVLSLGWMLHKTASENSIRIKIPIRRLPTNSIKFPQLALGQSVALTVIRPDGVPVSGVVVDQTTNCMLLCFPDSSGGIKNEWVSKLTLTR